MPMRNYDDGNKFNRLKLIVESTSEGVPRNTKELIKKLSRLAEFCVKLREEFGEYLSERFGDTPEWYEWDAGDC